MWFEIKARDEYRGFFVLKRNAIIFIGVIASAILIKELYQFSFGN